MKTTTLIKKIILVVILLILCNNSHSQNVTWLKVLQSYSVMYKTQQTSDGGFICVGFAQIGSYTKTFIVKLSPYGDSLWGKYYDLKVEDFYRGYWIEETLDRGFVIAGFGEGGLGDAHLVKIDSIGNLQWVKIISTPALDQGKCVKELPDKGFILMNRTAPFPYNHIVLIRTDSIGSVIWNKSYGNFDLGTEVEYIENSGFIVSGYRFEGDLSRLYLMRTDMNGDTLWTKTYYEFYRSAAYSIDVSEDKGFIIGGVADTSKNNFLKAYVVKTDSLGNIQWQKRYSTGYNETCYSIRKYKDKGYVFCGMSDSTYEGYSRAIIRIIDKSGNLLHENYFRPGNNNSAFHSVELTNDHGLIICGYNSQGNFGKGLIVRSDSGQIHPVSIHNNSNELIHGFKLHQNFPNPFNPETSISFELPKKEFVILKVFDLNGTEIITLINSTKLAGYHSVRFEGSGLSSGVYLYKIKVGQFEATGKMMLVK